ncbi:hypothetical protein V1512DRAFT_245012 [Lipomyces arxii]|uniref:uncharacterized protein n=1 Tax=Lipomyces arxii TaxID=56418 RepID=UPI0034CE27F3
MVYQQKSAGHATFYLRKCLTALSIMLSSSTAIVLNLVSIASIYAVSQGLKDRNQLLRIALDKYINYTFPPLLQLERAAQKRSQMLTKAQDFMVVADANVACCDPELQAPHLANAVLCLYAYFDLEGYYYGSKTVEAMNSCIDKYEIGKETWCQLELLIRLRPLVQN